MTCHDRLPEMLQRIVFMPDEVTLPDGATPQQYVNELAPFYPTFSQGTFLHLMQELEVEPDRKFKEMSFGQQKRSPIAASL
jgi:ABC-2 type transport system ATP-binding protein